MCLHALVVSQRTWLELLPTVHIHEKHKQEAHPFLHPWVIALAPEEI